MMAPKCLVLNMGKIFASGSDEIESSKGQTSNSQVEVISYYTHRIHVWYIYLHFVNVGKYTIHGWYGIVAVVLYMPNLG